MMCLYTSTDLKHPAAQQELTFRELANYLLNHRNTALKRFVMTKHILCEFGELQFVRF